ncbi:MAG: MmcB family DNA repair protein [Flavipsychrobacter sp.]|nr:MmcB family DNA repair protein [Flavipsychrobacter sp.]
MRDIDVRIALKSKTLSNFLSDKNALVIEEMGLFQGLSRIDIAVVNGSLYGYEIKSESDTLYRLDSQLRYYRQVFDYLTFVVGRKHVEPIKNLLPEWCGLIVATPQNKSDILHLKQVKRPKRNPEINSIAVAQLLWKDELLYLLNERGIKKGLSSKSKRDLWQLVADKYSVKELSAITRQLLKQRLDWRVAQ